MHRLGCALFFCLFVFRLEHLRRGHDPLACDISVIIPTFRRPVELAEAIASVRAQRDVALEIIVVDDAPEGYRQSPSSPLHPIRVHPLYPQSRAERRPAPVRYAISAGPWPEAKLVHFLDDDDKVPDGHYATALKEFAQFPDSGVLFGRIEPFGNPASLPPEETYFSRAARRAASCQRYGANWAYARPACCSTRRSWSAARR